MDAKPRVLIVDDAPENIWPLIRNLEDAYEVLYATSGEKALGLVFSEERPDLILLDIMMPGMDGYQVLERLRADKASRDIPVIFLTGRKDEADETKGLGMGAWDYITKPFSMPVVKARLKSVFNLKREMDRRLFLKEQMESLNIQLEKQVQDKMKELKEAQETLRASEERYRVLFDGVDRMLDAPRTILVVDDNPENIHVLARNLEEDYEVLYATSGEKALSIAFSGEPLDLILLDIMMPGLDGYEVCARLKADAATWDIPVIFITAMSQTEDESKGLELGAVDYISKPFSMPIVQARITTALNLKSEMDKRQMLTRKLQNLNRDLENRVTEKVAELKKAHEDLKISESNYRSIFENAVEGIYQSTLDGRFVTASPSMADILGYDSPEELIESVTDIAGQCYASSEQRGTLIRMLGKDGVVKRYETRMIRKDGTFIWGSNSCRLVRDDQGREPYIEGFFMDISRQKQAEEALLKNEIHLRQAQKMEAIGTLASGIAHDFNNILSPIMGYTEMCIGEMEEGSTEARYLGEVMKAAKRARSLVDQILSFSRQTEKDRKPIVVRPVVKEVAKLLLSAFPTSIEIRRDIRSESMISADPVEIHQVVMNLCTNSLHAMVGKGGILTIALTDLAVREGDDMHARGLAPGEYVRLTVGDTGYGMNREIREKIFEPYFTTKPKGEGTGLGLATVQGIVADLGGDIFVDSKPAAGSTFTVCFPAVKSGSGTAEATAPSTMAGPGREHVLLADDETQICEMMGAMLQSLGYRTTTHGSAVDALAAFKADPDSFDIILTDMTMPRMSGLEFAREALSLRPEIPIIILTGFSEAVDEKDALELGVRQLIMKPVGRSDLSRAVKKALGQ